ncbi:MAG: phosphatase PAP2 family protein [Verrucomicrobia bacterium]|nr:phosphatase PAP2 family protein [Verrucomicrobiota bacterium]
MPAATAIYMSIYLLFVAAPFVLRRRTEMRAMVIALMAVTGFAGLCFLLLPAEPAYPPPQNLGAWRGLFEFADWLNLRYNMLPSLHVALSVVCVVCFAARASHAWAILLWLWAMALAASTLLTHQHHLLDVVTGMVLALAACRLIYGRLVKEKS